jgi:apolipoprotein N-acyltransferase
VPRTLRFLAAILSGVLFAFAFPNVAIGWLIFVALLPLFLAVMHARGKWEAFFLGWTSQTVAWLLMVPWVVRVMSHYGGLPYVTGLLIFVAMSMYLGLYGGLFGAVVRRIDPGASFGRWLLVPLAWCAIEYARTYLLSGFPWNLIAAAIVDYTPLVLFDRVAGPYALGVLILLPSTLAAWWMVARPRGIERIVVTGLVVIVCFVWWATGLVAAKLIERQTAPQLSVAALLQPNISQEMRWDDANLAQIFQRMTAMTDDALAHGAHVVIWPESTVPLSYTRTEFYRDAIESVTRAKHADVILGSIAEDPSDAT